MNALFAQKKPPLTVVAAVDPDSAAVGHHGIDPSGCNGFIAVDEGYLC
jgi:hypothetical protein